MAIVVGTNSYVTEAELQAYADERGITIAGTLSQLLIKAMDWMEIQKYKGQKYSESQALEFPRNFTRYDVDSGDVPPDVKEAQYVAALYVDGGNELNPAVGRATKKEKVDVVEVEYMDNASSTTTYPRLYDILRFWLKSPYELTRV
jgi:hypothetical protein